MIIGYQIPLVTLTGRGIEGHRLHASCRSSFLEESPTEFPPLNSHDQAQEDENERMTEQAAKARSQSRCVGHTK